MKMYCVGTRLIDEMQDADAQRCRDTERDQTVSKHGISEIIYPARKEHNGSHHPLSPINTWRFLSVSISKKSSTETYRQLQTAEQYQRFILSSVDATQSQPQSHVETEALSMCLPSRILCLSFFRESLWNSSSGGISWEQTKCFVANQHQLPTWKPSWRGLLEMFDAVHFYFLTSPSIVLYAGVKL